MPAIILFTAISLVVYSGYRLYEVNFSTSPPTPPLTKERRVFTRFKYGMRIRLCCTQVRTTITSDQPRLNIAVVTHVRIF